MTKRGNPNNRHGVKCYADGIEFASKFERDVYWQLSNEPDITHLYCQVPFEINSLCQVRLNNRKKTIGRRVYIMDFLALTTDGEWHAIEAKGVATATWSLKRDLFILQYIANRNQARFAGLVFEIAQYSVIYQARKREDYRPLTKRLL